jgi:hypothetical protein
MSVPHQARIRIRFSICSHQVLNLWFPQCSSEWVCNLFLKFAMCVAHHVPIRFSMCVAHHVPIRFSMCAAHHVPIRFSIFSHQVPNIVVLSCSSEWVCNLFLKFSMCVPHHVPIRFSMCSHQVLNFVVHHVLLCGFVTCSSSSQCVLLIMLTQVLDVFTSSSEFCGSHHVLLNGFVTCFLKFSMCTHIKFSIMWFHHVLYQCIFNLFLKFATCSTRCSQ